MSQDIAAAPEVPAVEEKAPDGSRRHPMIADDIAGLHELFRDRPDVEFYAVVEAAVVDRVEAKTKYDKTYLKLQLRDRTGSIEARDFDLNTRTLTHPVLRVLLAVSAYNGQLAPVIKGAYELPAVDVDDMVGADRAHRDAQRERLFAEVDGLADGPYKLICEAMLELWSDEFCSWTAATKHHHNYVGGLLDHTLEVLDYARNVASMTHEDIDHDLLTAGALLHDLGKLDEYTAPPEVGRSVGGDLAYHLAYGSMRLGMIAQHVRSQGGFVPDITLFKLVHLIEQSHGEFRLDQSRRPILAEANCIATADLFSARGQRSERELDQLRRIAELDAVQQPPQAPVDEAEAVADPAVAEEDDDDLVSVDSAVAPEGPEAIAVPEFSEPPF